MFGIRNAVSLNYLGVSRVFFSTIALPKENKIRVGKYEINYLTVGNGPHKVFCAPGALGTIWTDFKPLIDGLKLDKFSLVVWDPPGYGKSRPPQKDFLTNFLENDADTAFELMKELQIPKFSVLGFSDGANTSLILAAKYPNAINKLVVWGAHSFVLPSELESYKKTRDVKKWSKELLESMTKLYGKEDLAKYWASWVDGMEAKYYKNKGNILTEHLKNIKCPTYILYGEKDPIVDCVHVSHLHTHISGSRIHLYPEGKHQIHHRYPEDFIKRVQEFLLQP